MKQLLKILTITLCVTTNLSEVFASASTPDLLIYKGDTLSFFANPLERYAEIDSIRFKLFGDIKTATTWSCIRGYIAEWKIIDNELYLNNIYSCTNRTVKANLKQLFKNQYRNRKVKAKWFTGNVLALNGKMLFSFNSAYDYYYDKEIEFEIKSGNVISQGDTLEPDELAQSITQQIKKEFDFDVSVIVLTIDHLKQIIDCNPFSKHIDKDTTSLYVTFLSSKPQEYEINTIEEKKLNGEEIVVSDNAVYIYCPNGYGKTKLTNSFLEKKLNTVATTRNWNTTNELLKIAQRYS